MYTSPGWTSRHISIFPIPPLRVLVLLLHSQANKLHHWSTNSPAPIIFFNTPNVKTICQFSDFKVSRKTEGRVCLSFTQANTPCSHGSTHSHGCAPFLSDQFAICACIRCVYSPSRVCAPCFFSRFPLSSPSPFLSHDICPTPLLIGLLYGCACALRGEDSVSYTHLTLPTTPYV